MMKYLVVFLCFGVLPCFYLECSAFQYKGFGHVQYGGKKSENKFIDKLRHHRSRRNTDGHEISCKTENCTMINHKYYVSQTFIKGQRFWRNIEENPNKIVHAGLSQSFLKRKTLKLSFQFPYYGHYLDRVVLTTRGFLYMDVHNTSLLTDVQYLAPLMAYFSPDHHPDSQVITLDDGSLLTVQWSKVYLRNRTSDGHFTFQCTLHKNGTIWFAYKQIPVDVSTIPSVRYHPVRVGISDAFVITYRNPMWRIIYRIFYIYSQVNITKNSVLNGSAVVFHPQTNCVGANSCTECMKRKQTTEFDCQWCPQTQRCSDKSDRHRAEWELQRCSNNAVKQLSDERCVAGTEKQLQRKSKKGIGAGAIVSICIVLVVVIGIAAWCVYAYCNPTTKSGLFLIDATRRPRELLKRSARDGGVRTGDAAPSDIKPQVL